MIHLFEQSITPAITALPWLSRWGGAAFPVQAAGSYYDPESGQDVRIRQTYPVSCRIQGDCDAEGYYSKLLPDDRLASLAWMEAMGGYSYEQDKTGAATVRQRIRLIFWLNMQRLGNVDCGGYLPYKMSVLQALPTGKQWAYTPEGFTKPAVVSVKFAGGVEHTPQAVFGPYTFAIQQRLFLHPYAFFGIDLDMSAYLPIGCFCLEEGEPIECLTTW
jgi:hypothetical protein